MNILLTGSGGFLGVHLKKMLQNNYNLLTPRSSELDLTNKIDTRLYVKQNKIDMIIH